MASIWNSIKTLPPKGEAVLVCSMAAPGMFDGCPVTATLHEDEWRVEWDDSVWPLKEFTHWADLSETL